MTAAFFGSAQPSDFDVDDDLEVDKIHWQWRGHARGIPSVWS